MDRRFATTALLLLLAWPARSSAQSLPSRIDRVPDGVIRLSFAARAGVCGDGRFIGEDAPDGFRIHTFWDHGYSIQTLEHVQPECEAGPLRLVVEKAGGRVRDLHAAVGVRWLADDDAVDLGLVPAAEAAAWLLDVAPALDQDDDVRVAFLAASVADSAGIARRLMALARDARAPRHVREQALRFLAGAATREGLAAQADETLRTIAADGTEPAPIRERAVRVLPGSPSNDRFLRDLYGRITDTGVRERILRRLGALQTDENTRWIRDVALDARQPLGLRERAVRVIGEEMERPAEVRALYSQLDEPALKERVLRVAVEHDLASSGWVRDVASSAAEPVSVRERAIRLLGERGDIASVRALYTGLDDMGLRERALRTVGEHAHAEGLEWVEQVALDRAEAPALRERAVRILAERGMGTAELSRLYDRVDSRAVRERLIRIFAERHDRPAVAKLEAIAAGDPDPTLRRSALRRLGNR